MIAQRIAQFWLLFAAASTLCLAQPTLEQLGPEFQVSSRVFGVTTSPVASTRAQDGFIVVWQKPEIHARVYSQDGSPLGPEIRVNDYSTNAQQHASVSAMPDGRFVVVWTSRGSAGGDNSYESVQARLFASSGTPLGLELQVNTYTTSAQWWPDVSVKNDGQFLVVWESNGSSGNDSSIQSIQGRLYSSAGVPITEETQINTYTTGAQGVPRVSALPDGRFLVVWQSGGSQDSDTSSTSIQARFISSNGLPLGKQFEVNTFTVGAQAWPRTAAGATGEFIVWTSTDSDETDTSGYSVHGRLYSSDGQPLGPSFQLNAYTTSDQWMPSVSATDQDGQWLVTWHSNGSAGTDTSERSVQLRVFSSLGAPTGPELQVNSYTTSAQAYPWVSMTSAGEFVVAWDSKEPEGTIESYRTVQAQRFRFPTPTVTGSATPTMTGIATMTPTFFFWRVRRRRRPGP
jgi:hypothetical protein